MTTLMVAVCGSGVAGGLMLVVLGIRGIEPPIETASTGGPSVKDRLGEIEQARLRVVLASVGAIGMGLLAPWPVAIVLAAAGGFSLPTLLGSQKRRHAAVAKTEAVATWAEQLRDTIGSSAGLQESITVTARVAPKEIRTQVQSLSLGMRRTQLSTLLRRFAHDVDDPAADQVSVALIMASERRGQNLTGLLSDVAEAARQEATMRMRTETSRAQTYSDAKAVTGIVLGVFALLLVVNRSYLSPFDSLVGQFIMGLVGAMWVSAVYGLAKLSVVRRGPRILSLTETEPETV